MNKLLVLSAVLIIAATGCAKKTDIIGAEKDAVLKYADVIADDILTGYNDEDYAKYSKDFDEQMKAAMTEKVFKQTREQIMSKIGKYASRKPSKVYKQEQFTVVEYDGDFENEKGVTVKVVMQKFGEKNLVSGLWFNSPKLRK